VQRDEHIRDLFEKYIAGKCNGEELEQLLTYLDAPNYDQELRDLISGEMQKADYSEDDELLLVITKNAEQRIFAKTRPKPFYQTTFFKIAVAATILIGLALLLIIGDKKKQIETITDTKISLAAGTEKAILSLANGKKVELGNNKTSELIDERGNSISQRSGEIIYEPNNLENNATNQLEVPKGGQYAVTISDGTKIWLNAGSKIIYPVTFAGKKQREVQLFGEAYFEVARDKTKPFIVHTEHQTIEVLGTHFNINTYSDEPQAVTTLTEGLVKVTTPNDKRKEFILHPGQMAATSKKQTVVGVADIESALAWQRGNFYFKNASIKTIMRQVSRWYDVEVEFKRDLPERHFTGGVHRNANLSELLKILMLNDIHFTLVNDQRNRKLIVEP
jgi:hypothetical protein